MTAHNSPVEYPLALPTVMFRPFIFEASDFNALLAASESSLPLGLAVVWRRQVAAAVRRAFSEPYLMVVGLYTLTFAWASVGNLGIIARQRVQVLPLLVLFLCVPALHSQRSSANPDISDAPSARPTAHHPDLPSSTS